jgi:hypothetical protein
MDFQEKLKKIKEERFDLSDYLIHFTRQGTKTSFDTLKDIIESGQLNCGWSIRGSNKKRTIFGAKPAICFTDMPLYSFYRYVKNRNELDKVDFYGIALHKSTMFKLGARNVIYGTTTENENETEENGVWTNPNLGPNEQYRYLLTKIDDQNDWTHEREWRWTNQSNRYKSSGDYLPIWKNNINYTFVEEIGDLEFSHEKRIFIITRYEKEVDELEKIFSNFNDRNIYNLRNTRKTFALSLEKVQSSGNLEYDKFDYVSLIENKVCRKMRKEFW